MKYKLAALGLLMIVSLVFGSSADVLGVAQTMNVLGVGTDGVQAATGRTPSTLLVENRRSMLDDLA